MDTKLYCSEGSFYERDGRIYVQGSVNGKTFKKSTGKKATPINKKWFQKQNPQQVLLQLLGIDKNKEEKKVIFEEYGLRILKATSSNRGKLTQDDIERLFINHIVPFFSHFEFKDVSSLDILEFLKRVDEHFSNDRAKRVKNILNLIFNSAYDDGLINKSPFSTQLIQKHKFKKKVSKTKAYTIFEVKKMLEQSKGWLKIFLEISIKYGLRTGECMGLKWEDFNLERGFFIIKRSITKGIITESSEIVHENKNHLREIFLFPETINLLKKYKNFKPDEEWLFVTKEGNPFMESHTILNCYFKPFLKEIEVEYKTLYATRRTYVSMMRQSDQISLEEIQDVVGHKKGSAITDKHYNLDVLEDAHKKKKAEHKSKIFNSLLNMT
jgi:integrase